MTPQCLLVTGGAGFIGSNFVHYWNARHAADRIIVLDALTYAGNRASLDGVEHPQGVRFVEGDIRDQERVESLMREERVDTVVHFAAESHVDRSILGPDAFLETNINGTHSLLKAARTVWGDEGGGSRRFHHVSTDEVYGSLGPGDPPFTEDSRYDPSSPYAASKAASDHLVRAYHRTWGVPVTISNCSNNYGPRHFPEKLIPLMLINSLLGKPLPIYGEGLNIRDWLYVVDHCRGIEAVLRGGRDGETYNIGGNCERTNNDIVAALCGVVERAFSKDPALGERFADCPAAKGERVGDLITRVKDRPGHDFRYAIDAAKIRSELDFAPDHSLESALQRTVQWYLDNEDWWRPLLGPEYDDWIKRQYG